ncbi:hypothetical protein K0M31_008620 [Melipona bicolor]|uniref:Uncharacterized protein n=1 Tax=Melipona bicolor TaxID=60889 RepID=A0AA40KJU7_9HYME|nr:hypothetical protein K0M31_008620 [Melipona bicolor]
MLGGSILGVKKSERSWNVAERGYLVLVETSVCGTTVWNRSWNARGSPTEDKRRPSYPVLATAIYSVSQVSPTPQPRED